MSEFPNFSDFPDDQSQRLQHEQAEVQWPEVQWPNTPLILSGAILHTLDEQTLEYLPKGYLSINEAGFIDYLGETDPEPVKAGDTQAGDTQAADRQAGDKNKRYARINLPKDTLVMPGLIDLHTHLPQYHAVGQHAARLTDWLDKAIYQAEIEFEQPENTALTTAAFLEALLANGTTTAAVFLSSGNAATETVFKTASRHYNRLIMGQTLMDCNAPAALSVSADSALAHTEARCRQWHQFTHAQTGQIHLDYAWVPRFALSSTEELLSGVGKLCQRYPQVYCHTHVSEQWSEVALVLEKFAWAKNYIDVYQQFGLLGAKSLLAHGIHLSAQELAVIQAQHARLIHCPTANFFLKSGRFDLPAVQAHKINWALGSDWAAGTSLLMFDVMKNAQFTQESLWIEPETLLYRATLGAAEVLEKQATLGNFLPGKAADLIVVKSPAKAKTIKKTDKTAGQRIVNTQTDLGADRLARLIYTATPSDILMTVIAGRCVYQRRGI